MQPTLRQVPPNVPCSQIAIRMSPYRGSTLGSGMLLPEPVLMIVRSKCSTPSAPFVLRRAVDVEVVIQPRVQLAVGGGPRLRKRQEHVVLGVGDGRDGGAVAHTAGPAGDLGDVEDGVAALDHLGVRCL